MKLITETENSCYKPKKQKQKRNNRFLCTCSIFANMVSIIQIMQCRKWDTNQNGIFVKINNKFGILEKEKKTLVQKKLVNICYLPY